RLRLTVGRARLSDPFWTLVASTRVVVPGPSAKGCAAGRGAGDVMSVPPQWSVGGSPSENPVAAGAESSPPMADRSAATLALVALVVCIAAFVLGFVPLLGLLL